MRAIGLVLAALFVLGGCTASVTVQSVGVEQGRATLTVNGRTVEAWGEMGEVNSTDERIWVECRGHGIMIEERRLTVDGKTRPLPPWKRLVVDGRGAELRFTLDDRPLP